MLTCLDALISLTPSWIHVWRLGIHCRKSSNVFHKFFISKYVFWKCQKLGLCTQLWSCLRKNFYFEIRELKELIFDQFWWWKHIFSILNLWFQEVKKGSKMSFYGLQTLSSFIWVQMELLYTKKSKRFFPMVRSLCTITHKNWCR